MSPYPIEIEPPDLEQFRRGTERVDYVHVFASGQPGPVVMINALTHGNELCGALAVKTLLEHGVRPRRGSLILSFANVAAFARFTREAPDTSRFVDEDFNRVWSAPRLDAAATSVELERARALRPFVDSADFLFDLHSMHEPCVPLMVCGPLQKSVRLAQRLGTPACLVQDQGHPAGTRMRDYGAFADPGSPRTALLIECGQHWERSAPDVALDSTARFLVVTGAVDKSDIDPAWLLPLPKAQDLIAVSDAIVTQSGRFEFARAWRGLDTLAAGTTIGWDDGAPVVAPYDDCVLVMPSLTHARPGATVVRLGKRTRLAAHESNRL